MPFTDDVVRAAWDRANGSCECGRPDHNHGGKCRNVLLWANRGGDEGFGAWQACHKVSPGRGGSDILANCEIRCLGCIQSEPTTG